VRLDVTDAAQVQEAAESVPSLTCPRRSYRPWPFAQRAVAHRIRSATYSSPLSAYSASNAAGFSLSQSLRALLSARAVMVRIVIAGGPDPSLSTLGSW